jgi:hypothetical protein
MIKETVDELDQISDLSEIFESIEGIIIDKDPEENENPESPNN